MKRLLLSLPSRSALLAAALFGLAGGSSPVQAVPLVDLEWSPAPFLYAPGTTISPHVIWGRPIAFDFNPWDAVLARDGQYYGTVNYGAAPGGIVYALSAASFYDGTPRTFAAGLARRVYLFASAPTFPKARLTGNFATGTMAVGQDGFIYGRTAEGGAFGAGLLYKVDRTGRYQTVHHFEKHGIAGQMIVAQDGTLYAATSAFDSSDAGWVFRLSKDGSYRNIPIGNGEIRALAETADHTILVATTPRPTPPIVFYGVTSSIIVIGPIVLPPFNPIPPPTSGILWRLNEQEDFVQLADLADPPRKLLPLANGNVLAATQHRILRVTPAGAVTVAHEFTKATDGLDPNFLTAYKDLGFFGATSTGGPGDGGLQQDGPRNGGTSFFMKTDFTGFTTYDSIPTRLPPLGNLIYLVWMNSIFPNRVTADEGNLPPIAKDDVVSTTTLKRFGLGPQYAIVRVLDNDSDADKNPLTITSVSTPGHGFAVIDQSFRTITYSAHNFGPVQNDTFTYTISDGQGGTAVGHVYLRTNPTGRYLGNVTFASAPGTAAGSLLMNVAGDRSVTARLQFQGRIYRFIGRFNESNQLAAVLKPDRATDPTNLSIQLLLRPAGAKWTVEAAIQNTGTPFKATCTFTP